MTHAPHKARRIQTSAIPYARLAKHLPMRKDLLLGALVGGTMLVITGLYAATFRYQKAFNQPIADFPRWTALTDGLIEHTRPIQQQADKVKGALIVLAKAKRTQIDATEVLKKKLADRTAAPATETPETR